MSDQELPPPTPPELAGYLLWYCGGRGCAIAYAHASKLPAVAEILRRRTEVVYTPPAPK